MAKNVTNLAEAYAKLLASMNVEAKSDGPLVQYLDGVEKHIRVDNKPLVLPTKKVVDNYTEDMVVFHPLSENTLLGESPVLQELRILVMDKLNDLTMRTIEALLKIAIDQKIVESLSTTQVDLMRATAGADTNALKNWQAIMRRIEPRSHNARLLTVFLKRGANLDDVKYPRAAIVNFNMYTELEDGKSTLMGVKIRKADFKLYARIFEAIFPDINEQDAYSAGSNSALAPYFDALIHAYDKVLTALNSVTWLMRKHIQEVNQESLHVKDDFMDDLRNLAEYRDTLPVMPYNDGDRQERRKDESPQVQQQAPQQQTPPPPPPPPVQPAPPQPQTSPFHQPPPQQPVQQPQYQQPQPVQQPQYQQGQPTQQQQNNTSLPPLNAQLSGVPMSGQMPQMYPQYQQPQQQQMVSPQMQQNPYAFGGMMQQMPQQQQNPFIPNMYQQQQQPQNPFIAPQYQQQQMMPQQQNMYMQQGGYMQPQALWPTMPVNWK